MWVRGRARARQSSDGGGWRDEKNGREEPDRAELNPPTGQKHTQEKQRREVIRAFVASGMLRLRPRSSLICRHRSAVTDHSARVVLSCRLVSLGILVLY